MNYQAQRIKDQYNPDAGDIAVGRNGQFISVTWAEYALLEMIEAQQKEIDELKAQVAAIHAAKGSTTPRLPKNNGSNRGRNKLFKT